MCQSCISEMTSMLINDQRIFCVRCKEPVSYDGGNWINCHCFGCRDYDTEAFPPQWGVDDNYNPPNTACSGFAPAVALESNVVIGASQ